MPKSDTALLVAAEVYVRGWSFAISDEGRLLVLKPVGDPLPEELRTALDANGAELRRMTYEGIRAALEGYQPALDGLEREGARND